MNNMGMTKQSVSLDPSLKLSQNIEVNKQVLQQAETKYRALEAENQRLAQQLAQGGGQKRKYKRNPRPWLGGSSGGGKAFKKMTLEDYIALPAKKKIQEDNRRAEYRNMDNTRKGDLNDANFWQFGQKNTRRAFSESLGKAKASEAFTSWFDSITVNSGGYFVGKERGTKLLAPGGAKRASILQPRSIRLIAAFVQLAKAHNSMISSAKAFTKVANVVSRQPKDEYYTRIFREFLRGKLASARQLYKKMTGLTGHDRNTYEALYMPRDDFTGLYTKIIGSLVGMMTGENAQQNIGASVRTTTNQNANMFIDPAFVAAVFLYVQNEINKDYRTTRNQLGTALCAHLIVSKSRQPMMTYGKGRSEAAMKLNAQRVFQEVRSLMGIGSDKDLRQTLNNVGASIKDLSVLKGQDSNGSQIGQVIVFNAYNHVSKKKNQQVNIGTFM